MTERHLAAVWEAVADALPQEVALVHGGREIAWRDFDDRAARLATAFRALGLRPGAKVAIDLYNCPEYFEVFLAAAKIDAVSVNVNYRYRHDELLQLLTDADVEAIVVHRSLSERVLPIVDRLPLVRAIVQVDQHGATAAVPDGVYAYEQLIADHDAASRQHHTGGMFLSYTGGTTGLPKGVMYTMEGVTERSLDTRPLICGVGANWTASVVEVARELRDRGVRPVALPASPLMHSTGFTFVSLPALCAGGTVVTCTSTRFDAEDVLATIERRGATVAGIVGDAFALPIVKALDERAAAGHPYDTSTLRTMCSAGVAWSGEVKRRLLDHVPQLVLVDGCGSTEGGTYGISIVRHGDPAHTARFQPAAGTFIMASDGSEAPDGVEGLIAARTATSGYYKHPDATAERFRTIAGLPYVVPGDYGRIEPDGSITLIGRGSSTINIGGEKVHPEEVEDVIRSIDGVDDCLVLGLTDERLGQVVAALVQPTAPASVHEDDVVQWCRQQLAGYKVPRLVAMVAAVPRFPNGKADLAGARQLAVAADGSDATKSQSRSRV